MGDIDSMVKYAWIGFRDVKDFGKGVELKNLLEKGAANGNIEAVYYLACIYEGGYTIPRNIDLSVRLYKKAAEKGSKDDMSIALILDIDGMKGVFNPIKVRISETKGDIDLNVS